MSHATDPVRSTRGDARAFADAFAAADDAFTFESQVGESRELSLDELADVIALPPRPSRQPATPAPEQTRAHTPVPRSDPGLLTIDELADVLAQPVARQADVLDFDFGTSAHERARRRTAARLGGPAPRRVSGPGPARARSDVRLAEVGAIPAARASDPATGAGSRTAMADAAASTAERLALRSSDDPSASPVGRRTVEMTGRLEVTSTASHVREGRHARPGGAADWLVANPDRIAMWAVLLGIVLVLIAFTSGSAGAVALPVLAGL